MGKKDEQNLVVFVKGEYFQQQPSIITYSPLKIQLHDKVTNIEDSKYQNQNTFRQILYNASQNVIENITNFRHVRLSQ